MASRFYNFKKISAIFGQPDQNNQINKLEKDGVIPSAQRYRSGAIFSKGYPIEQLPLIGEHIGFLKKPKCPTSMAIFTTKGGVLKSTLALNIARASALHNIKTCVVGLDIQGDITSALGFDNDISDSNNLEEVISKLEQTKGLADYFNNKVRLSEIINKTNIPTLDLIPETAELAAFNESLNNINRREYWIKENVTDILKRHYDLVIMDCSPNWNKLTTNALMACDVLVSPLECKINNFRNFKLFKHFLNQFQSEMKKDFSTLFIPTKFNSNRKLSTDILNWYQNNVEHCSKYSIRESVLGEEASALSCSVVEHAPKKKISIEMRLLLQEIYEHIGCSPTEATETNNINNFDQQENHVWQ